MTFARLLRLFFCLTLFVCYPKTDFAQDLNWTRPGKDWPTFLGSNQDGISSETGIRTDWSNGQLPLIWKTDVGEGYSIGSVADRRFVHFDRADRQARIRCFDAETGRLLWNQSYPSEYRDMYGYDSGPRTSPVIDGKRLFTLGVEGQLKCWLLSDGTPQWSVNLIEKFGVVQNFFGVGGTPVVYENLLIVMVGGSPAESREVAPGRLDEVKPNGSAIVAFNKTTGKEVYRIGMDLASYATIRVLVQPKQPDIGLAFCRNGMVGFEPRNGKELFQFPWRAKILESVNASTPVARDNRIFLTECYGPGSVLLENRKNKLVPLWSDQGRREKSLQAHWNTPILRGNYLYASSGRNGGNADFRCIEFTTGKTQWKKRGLARSSATWIDQHLVVLGERGDLVLLKEDPTKYNEVTRLNWDDYKELRRLRSPCWSAPVISHGLMWVKGGKQLLCFELIPNSPAKQK